MQLPSQRTTYTGNLLEKEKSFCRAIRYGIAERRAAHAVLMQLGLYLMTGGNFLNNAQARRYVAVFSSSFFCHRRRSDERGGGGCSERSRTRGSCAGSVAAEPSRAKNDVQEIEKARAGAGRDIGPENIYIEKAIHFERAF